MNKVELSKQLQSMGISPNKYSLEGSVATWDTIVLVKNYNIWKVLYIDERGNQNELASFKTENDACKFIYNEFKREVNFFSLNFSLKKLRMKTYSILFREIIAAFTSYALNLLCQSK